MDEMEKDIPKNIVIVLIVITLIISVAGTWIVSERLDAGNAEAKAIGGSEGGNIGFEIIEEESKVGSSAGNIGLVLSK